MAVANLLENEGKMAFKKKVFLGSENVDQETIDNFISGGGLVASDLKKEEPTQLVDANEWVRIILRIRLDAVKEIDKLVTKRMGITRTAWMLEAIQEKLERIKG